MGFSHTMRALLLGSASTALLAVTPAAAQSTQQIDSIEQQIHALNNELKKVRRDLAAKDAAVHAAQQDAALARQQSQSTQATVASLRAPQGFAPGNGGTSNGGFTIGAGPAPGYNPTAGGPLVATDMKAPGQPSTKGTFHLGGVTVTLGGFIEMAALGRTRNEVTDIASSYNSIPLGNSPAHNEGEFRETARQSRASILVQGDVDPTIHLAAYSEVDFQGSAPTANSNESDSYNPRLRVAYATVDDSALGLHVLAGQNWSLMTVFKKGMNPRQEDVPLTIDAQYVPGFSWARQPQFRVTKDFDDQKFWIGASLENPQTTVSAGSTTGTIVGGTPNFNNTGVSNLNTTTTYSNNDVPDLIVKAAADPGWGHYEIYGVLRDFDDRVSIVGSGHNNTRLAGGGGAAAILPIVPTYFDLHLSGIAGYGLGRYGSAQLPDATLSQSGAVVPLPAFQVLVGGVSHPTPSIDLYAYVGTEQVGKSTFKTGKNAGGYGNPAYSNAGCDTELSTATCTANTSGVTQGTIGAWYRPFVGNYGTVQVGAQYAYTKKTVFDGVTAANGTGNKGTDENEVLVSFRYYPFQ